MSLVLTILQGILLVVLAFFALGIAKYVFSIGTGVVGWASILQLGLPRWVRWIILLPVLGLAGFLLILTFNVIFWIGSWFGDSFVGTAWIWVTTFTQSVIMPRILVATGYMIAPAVRRLIAIVVMLAIWSWLAGTLLDPDTGDFAPPESDVWAFYGWLVVAAGSAAYAVIKFWNLDPLLRLVEQEMRGEFDPSEHITEQVGEQEVHLGEHVGQAPDTEISLQFCPSCRNERVSQHEHYCRFCGAQYG